MTVVAIFGLASITIAQTVPSYVPTNGLVGWWPFNGNANDESGNGNNGTVNGATLTTDRLGNVNAAYSFDGIDDFISGNSNNLNVQTTNKLTLASWVYVNQFALAPAASKIITHTDASNTGQQYALSIGNDGSLYFLAGNGDFENNGPNLSPAGQIQSNTWQHLAVVISSDSVKLYLNGNMVMGKPENDVFPANPVDVFVFSSLTNTTFNMLFNGLIDDIGIWNRDLNSCEIGDLYFTSLGNCCAISINTQPTNQTINLNNNAQFALGSTDPNATYQWQTDLGVGFQNLNNVGQYSGTTTNILSVSNVTMSNNNQLFRCIASSGSCSDTSNVAVLTVNNNVGIIETSQDKLFSVFPNPTQSVINVKADSKLIGEVYTIYDNAGRVVLTGKLNSQNTKIELGNLSGGIYMLSVGENMKQTFKVIKE